MNVYMNNGYVGFEIPDNWNIDTIQRILKERGYCVELEQISLEAGGSDEQNYWLVVPGVAKKIGVARGAGKNPFPGRHCYARGKAAELAQFTDLIHMEMVVVRGAAAVLEYGPDAEADAQHPCDNGA